MSDADIIDLGKRMRALQQRYFRERKSHPAADLGDLVTVCRRAERAFDEAVAARDRSLRAAERPALFPEDPAS